MSAAVLSRSIPIVRGTGTDVDDEAVGVRPPQMPVQPGARAGSVSRPQVRRRPRRRTGPRGARYQQRRRPAAAVVRFGGAPAVAPVPLTAGPHPRQWRLTARGRALLNGVTVSTTLIVAGLVLAAGMFTLVRAVSGPTPQDAQVVIVEPGQTLWQIAGERSAGGNQADMVARIRDLNHLHGTTLQPGQRLLVPAAG